jgi:hypothetical protein
MRVDALLLLGSAALAPISKSRADPLGSELTAGVRLSSGPVLNRQTRAGRDGRDRIEGHKRYIENRSPCFCLRNGWAKR